MIAIFTPPDSIALAGDRDGSAEGLLIARIGRATGGHDGWNSALQKMATWIDNPDIAGEMEAPSNALIDLAINIGRHMRGASCPAPAWVLPGGEGDIQFEWRSGADVVTLEMAADRTGQLIVFRDGRLAERHAVAFVDAD